jgi:hypothetical protein
MVRLSRIGCSGVLFIILGTIASGLEAEDRASTNPGQEKQDNSLLNVKITWEYKDLPPNMKIYQPPRGAILKLWETAVVKDHKDLPVSDEINNSVLKLRRGTNKTFVLVYKNDTDLPIYFFAAPHQVTPPEYSLGFKLKCLCINQAFQVGPGEIWYRVVELQISKNIVGDAVGITHTLIGISKERMGKFNSQTPSFLSD